jgi:phage tail-like protein
MAELRAGRAYSQFNFLVYLGDGKELQPEGGFQEMSPIAMEVAVVEYRNGNAKENSVQKFTGLNKATDITLKRGVIGSLGLYTWLNDIRNGDPSAKRNITIELRDEAHTKAVQTWRLKGAQPTKISHGPLSAKGTDVAMEECTLAYERLEIE